MYCGGTEAPELVWALVVHWGLFSLFIADLLACAQFGRGALPFA
jgi:hypothetical protein